MKKTAKRSGQILNEIFGLNACHALYREDGKWYHKLKAFPGVLFDANGYVLFKTEKAYFTSSDLQIRKDLHIRQGISLMPDYVRISENAQISSIAQFDSLDLRNKIRMQREKLVTNSRNIPIGKLSSQRSIVHNYRILRNTRVGEWVKFIHNYECQICGTPIIINSRKKYAEAHHIKPLGGDHNGPDVIENVICVCPNHHVLLDYGAIQIELSKLHTNELHKINLEYVNYHNMKIIRND